MATGAQNDDIQRYQIFNVSRVCNRSSSVGLLPENMFEFKDLTKTHDTGNLI